MYGRRAQLRGREPSLRAVKQGVADARGAWASGLTPITVHGRVAVATRSRTPPDWAEVLEGAVTDEQPAHASLTP